MDLRLNFCFSNDIEVGPNPAELNANFTNEREFLRGLSCPEIG